MQSQKLPIGIQSFQTIRTEGYIYIDKTPWIARMASQGKPYFLSRPRRFGKSLLVDTLEMAFSGRRELFAGLYLDSPESGWDWNRKHPVVRISFGIGSFRNLEELRESILYQLDEAAHKLGTESLKQPSPALALMQLVKQASKHHKAQTVVLIDEYDKPILDALPDLELAAAMRSELRSLYGVLKDADPYLRFVFLTGVSKFSKAGVFSGLNQLNDLTLNPNFDAVCGYTQEDVDRWFAPLVTKYPSVTIQSWYNGYSWGPTSVYNPFDILLLCENQELRPWWFETGTPSFLVRLLKDQPRSLPELDNLLIGAELTDSFEPERMHLAVMLFQTGYLTIKEKIEDPIEGMRYRLGFPNHEVRSAFSRLALDSALEAPEQTADTRNRLREVLYAGDSAALRELFTAFFESVPNDNYRNNPIARYEGFYATVVYAYFASLGLTVIPEDVTNRGRIDLTVIGPRGIWIFEFKVQGVDRSGDAAPLGQILGKGYAGKYKGRTSADGQPLPIRQIGITFDAATRTVVGWEEAGATEG
jgi:hypothetical protein